MENFTEVNNTELTPQHHIPKLSWTNILIGVVLYCIVLVTILGNILVLIAVSVNKNLQTTFNYYVVNLAITDFAVAVTAMSFHTTDNMLGYWPFGGFLCGVWIFFDYGMTFVSVFTLILISVDRFWSVTWSLHYRKYHSKKKSIISIVFVWLFMLALWLPPCIHDRLYNAKPGECIWEPSLNKEFVLVVAVVGHHGACVIMLFCYIKVFIFMFMRRKVLAKNRVTADKSQVSTIDNEHVSSYGQTAMLNTSVFLASETKSALGPCSSNGNQTEVPARHDMLEVPVLQGQGTIKQNGSIRSDGHTRRQRDKAVFITLTYVIIGYAICWIPFHVVFDISSVCPSCVPRGVYSVTFWMTYLNSTINPFLYNFSTPEFRRTFRRLICRGKLW